MKILIDEFDVMLNVSSIIFTEINKFNHEFDVIIKVLFAGYYLHWRNKVSEYNHYITVSRVIFIHRYKGVVHPQIIPKTN